MFISILSLNIYLTSDVTHFGLDWYPKLAHSKSRSSTSFHFAYSNTKEYIYIQVCLICLRNYKI